MQINEEHIMRYVFSRNSLSEDVREYIERHLEDFTDQIELCTDLNDPFTEEDNKIISRMIETAFPEGGRIFELYPRIDRILPKQDVLTLAAASENQSRIETLSFTDKENNVIIRIIKENNESRLYLFPLNETENTYKVVLYPSEETISINDIKISYSISSDIISRILVQVVE